MVSFQISKVKGLVNVDDSFKVPRKRVANPLGELLHGGSARP
jgi:hypothetical protein